jgi:hypothetical protein
VNDMGRLAIPMLWNMLMITKAGDFGGVLVPLGSKACCPCWSLSAVGLGGAERRFFRDRKVSAGVLGVEMESRQ